MKHKTIKDIISNIDNLFNEPFNIEVEILSESVGVLRDILCSLNTIICVFDSTPTILWINNICHKITGYTQEEFKSGGFDLIDNLYHPQEKHIIEKRKMLLKHGKDYVDLVRIKHKNNNYLWLKTDVKVFKKQYDGTPYIFMAIITDISKLLTSEEKSDIKSGDNQNIKLNLINCKLTLREKEILKLIVEGFAGKQIANKLNISFNTLRTHRTNMKKKLNINCIAGLVNYYRDNIDGVLTK